MSTLLLPKVRADDELIRDLPAELGEVVSESSGARGTAASPSDHQAELIEAAHGVAREIYGCGVFSERLKVYGKVGRRFKADARRVLNIAAARWPELIPTVNDQPEWKALLSADLS